MTVLLKTAHTARPNPAESATHWPVALDKNPAETYIPFKQMDTVRTATPANKFNQRCLFAI
ncbi:MAG: hypothetical protein RI563_05960 [Thiohalophilus sp.]|uniref:hypothetical protein n=1 Tax=Thiohalophilus sp. TaxID=3028392 RepID=UPI00287094CF|nr:hypothetical protein [Thiohalophilus sp.]MDR9436403.1 hypothetical protein [Thiohalophilus sp.]